MKAFLFDLDGVVIDTETQYTVFWDMVGRDFLHINDFGPKIKGQSLEKIFAEYFSVCTEEQIAQIKKKMYDLEKVLVINYIPGAKDFILEARSKGIKTAVVTSSTKRKMEVVYRQLPEMRQMFDAVLTSEDFPLGRGKPSPDCYLIAAEKLDAEIKDCVVFEDSYSGLQAGKSAGMKLVGLATTHTIEEIQDKADIVVKDFTELDIEKILE